MAGLRARLPGRSTSTASRMRAAAAISITLGIAPALAMQGEGPDASGASAGSVPSESSSVSWAGNPAPSYEQASALRREIRSSRVFPGCNGCCTLRYVGPRKFGLDGLES